jgi:hypothetical protein
VTLWSTVNRTQTETLEGSYGSDSVDYGKYKALRPEEAAGSYAGDSVDYGKPQKHQDRAPWVRGVAGDSVNYGNIRAHRLEETLGSYAGDSVDYGSLTPRRHAVGR